MMETPILTKISKSKYDHSCYPVVAHNRRKQKEKKQVVTES